ncbi:MAG: hypothetical protein LC790_12985 [Actinobacteria bacterium]|nr:hypothetical protein [Actinomycetota bacterium]
MSAATIATPPAAPVRPAPPPARAVRWALARVEGRRLLRHPIFLLGMALSAVTLALATGRLPFGASDYSETPSMLAGDCFVMLGGALWTFVAVFLATSRERRDAAQDFYAAQPTTARLRTEATLLSLAWAGLAGAALIALGTLLLVGLDGALVTDVNLNGPAVDQDRRFAVQALELLQGPLLLASWTRHVYAAVFGALMLFLPPLALLPWFVFDDGRGFLGAVRTGGGVGGVAPIAWQLLGLAAVAAAAAAGALARYDRRLVVLVIAAISVAVLVLGLPAGPEAPPLPGQPPAMTP